MAAKIVASYVCSPHETYHQGVAHEIPSSRHREAYVVLHQILASKGFAGETAFETVSENIEIPQPPSAARVVEVAKVIY